MQECQFIARQRVRAAVIENGEVRRSVIEAVVERAARVLPEQSFGQWRPNVMVARCEIERKPPKRFQQTLDLAPFGFRRLVVQPLNSVADAENECRLFARDVAPYPLMVSNLKTSPEFFG